MLQKTEDLLRDIKDTNYQILNQKIEDFKFDQNFDGIIISNVLPFLKNKEDIKQIVNNSLTHLNKGGFLYFTLFGVNDEWAKTKGEAMSFYTKEEALNLLKEEPYFYSEDYGRGTTMKGDMKTWHVFHLLYIK